MSDSELETAEGTTLAEDRLDEDDRLKPEFVSAVMERSKRATTRAPGRSSNRSIPPTSPICSSWSIATIAALSPRRSPESSTATSSPR